MLWCSAAWLLASIALAADPPKVDRIEVHVKDGKCGAPTEAFTGAVGSLVVRFDDPVELERAVVQVNGQDANGADVTVDPANGSLAVRLQPGNDRVTITLQDQQEFTCEGTFFEAEPGGGGTGGTSEPDGTDARMDVLAQKWLGTEEGQEAVEALSERLAGEKKPVTLLVHLPSGAPAAGTPADLREGVGVQVAVVLPMNGETRATLKVDSCAAPSGVALDAPPEGDKQGDRGGGNYPTLAFALLPRGQVMHCGAPELSYTLTTSQQAEEVAVPTELATAGSPVNCAFAAASNAETTKIRLRNVHHVAAIAALGYDLGQSTSYQLAVSSDGSDPKIEELQSSVGPSVYLGAVWYWGGFDFEEPRLYNYFSPFLAVNVTDPLGAVVGGLAVSPTGGISLAVGASMHRGAALADGYRVGDMLPTGSTIPTRATWTDQKPGLFVGVTVQSDIYDALVARFKP